MYRDGTCFALDADAAAVQIVEPHASFLRAEAIGGTWRRFPVKRGERVADGVLSGRGASRSVIWPSASSVSETAPKRAVAV